MEDNLQRRVIGQEGGAILLRQDGAVNLLILSRRFTVTFRVTEQPMRDIVFDAIAGDFTRFRGRWHLEPHPDGTLVEHEVEVEPSFFAPRWALRWLERQVMLASLKAVMARCLQAEGSR